MPQGTLKLPTVKVFAAPELIFLLHELLDLDAAKKLAAGNFSTPLVTRVYSNVSPLFPLNGLFFRGKMAL